MVIEYMLNKVNKIHSDLINNIRNMRDIFEGNFQKVKKEDNSKYEK